MIDTNQDINHIFDASSILYDNDTKTITYEASQQELFSNINFDLSATYTTETIPTETIPTENITTINNIQPNVIGSYQIFFQAFYIQTFDSETLIINFNVIDTIPPDLSFIISPDFEDIYNLKLPLLSSNSINELNNDINHLNNNNLNNPYLFIKDTCNNTIFSIPGVHISDIIGNSTNTLNNETIPSDFFTNYALNMKYEILSGIEVSNNYLLDNSGVYIQNYKVFDSAGNYTDISRSIIIERFSPFINLIHESDINGHSYKKIYHEQYYLYEDLLGNGYDYYEGELSFNKLNIQENINENILGLQNVKFKLENNNTDNSNNLTLLEREVHVVEINCLSSEKVVNFDEIISSPHNNDIKHGVYNGVYNLNIDNSQNAIRIFGYDYTSSSNIDISNLINISGANTITINDKKYYWGQVLLNVYGNFNRASLEYLNYDSKIEDLFLYSAKCESFSFDKIINLDNISYHYQEFTVNVEKNIVNPLDEILSYYTISGKDFGITKKKDLYLSIGKYRFIQSGYKNFYNPIKFSTIEDGIHNPEYEEINHEYKKNVIFNKLPGTMGSYTEILIDATIPSPIYYYSKNFPKMGGKIELKNNIILTKNNISLNGNVLSSDNSNVLIAEYTDDNILKNRVFLSHKFDISNNDEKKTTNLISLTHRNINHNIIINKNANQIIFKKHQAKIESDYIKHDVSDNYLYDNSVNNITSNIFGYDYKTDVSENLLQNTESFKYQIDAKAFFYENNELNKYNHYFMKNYMENTKLYVDDFIYKINELNYINHVQLLDADQTYNFYEDKYLSSSRLIFNSILDNYITFNLQTYIDFSNLSLPIDKINYIKENREKNTNTNISTNYPIDENKLLFQEYVINIYSDICGSAPDLITTKNQDIIISQGSIELNTNLLDSSGIKDAIYKVYNDTTINQGIDKVDEILQDRVFLSVRDVSMTNGDENEFIGLTQQNIFHNMFVNIDNKFIFHKYNPDINNYQINYPELTLEKTLTDTSNNKKYLLEISSNDIYNCFVDNSKNIYENMESKNRHMPVNPVDKNYNIHISYFINNELDNNNEYLFKLDIRPTSLNNINYETNPYSYNSELQQLHSHSYIIDLNDYFNRLLYTGSHIKMPYNNINHSNLNYKITDISYIKDFNIFDIDSLQNIIYDKTNIHILNYLESFIHTTNFKINYLYSIQSEYYAKI